MEWSLADVEELLIVPLKDGERERLIGDLSTIFTTKRDKIDKYVSDKKLVSAYTLYFLLSNMKKLDFLFSELSHDILNELQQCRLVDFGCGPGTYGLAWWNFFAGETQEIWEIDSSKTMLEQSRKLVSGLTKSTKFLWGNSIASIIDQKRTCLLFGNSMNEMSDEDIYRLVDKLNPEYLLFIEPGTKEVFARFKKIISEITAQKHYSTIYPCLQTAACPMQEDNWCHQVIKCSYPQDYESLCQRVKKDRRKLPTSLYLFKRGSFSYEVDENCVTARVIQLIQETKYSFIFEVCLDHDGCNDLKNIEVLKKGFTKREQKILVKIEYGRKIFFEYVKQRDDSTWIVELIGENI